MQAGQANLVDCSQGDNMLQIKWYDQTDIIFAARRAGYCNTAAEADQPYLRIMISCSRGPPLQSLFSQTPYIENIVFNGEIKIDLLYGSAAVAYFNTKLLFFILENWKFNYFQRKTLARLNVAI